MHSTEKALPRNVESRPGRGAAVTSTIYPVYATLGFFRARLRVSKRETNPEIEVAGDEPSPGLLWALG